MVHTVRARGSWRAAGLGVLFLAVGATSAFVAPEGLRWQLALAAFFLGSFLIVILGPRAEHVPELAVIQSLYASLDAVLGDLDLETYGVYVPAGSQRQLSRDRVFVPARGTGGALPALDDETSLVSGGKGGFAVEPPGLALLEAHEAATGVRLDQVPFGEVGVLLEGAQAGECLLKGVALRREGELVTVRFRHGQYGELCRLIRERWPDTGHRFGCPTCSATHAAVARASGRPAKLAGWTERGEDTILEVELL